MVSSLATKFASKIKALRFMILFAVLDAIHSQVLPTLHGQKCSMLESLFHLSVSELILVM